MSSRMFLILATIAVVLLVALGCNTTPTVPVPPPEACAIPEPPDESGYCTVECERQSDEEDVALVFNDELGVGVMELVESVAGDGSFAIEIEADPGDTITVEIKRNGELSSQKILVVPE